MRRPLKGKYTGYFQLERLSEAPPAAPPPSPVATAIPIVPIMATIATPAPPPRPTSGISELPTQNPRIGQQTLKPPEAPPAGPPPTQLSASSENAARHLVRWQNASGATTFNVFRRQADRWINVVAGTPSTQAVDPSFVARGTVYQVEARYADGRVGKAEVTLANPPQPLVVGQLNGTQTG